MQTRIDQRIIDGATGAEADAILRSCVHCGFCTAHCPTYQLLGDELDGPRGRIYLIKEMLEGGEVSERTRTHLDRCLTCRACESVCPSGVRYGRLADIGRQIIEQRVERKPLDRWQRRLLRAVLPYPKRIAPLIGVARRVKALLPETLRAQVPDKREAGDWPQTRRARRMLALGGCVQSIVTPATNAALARILDRLGVQLSTAPGAGCCGALSHHLSEQEEALNFMRRNIDAWWSFVEQGVEAILVSASGCATVVKEYGELLRHDKDYAERAARVAALVKDPVEVLSAEPVALDDRTERPRIAFHSPCTLQHGQRLDGAVEALLTRLGFELVPVEDAHLCCGSAGTYSILQPELSERLRDNKLRALRAGQPQLIATANIGCQLHLAQRSEVPVVHWLELLDTAWRAGI